MRQARALPQFEQDRGRYGLQVTSHTTHHTSGFAPSYHQSAKEQQPACAPPFADGRAAHKSWLQLFKPLWRQSVGDALTDLGGGIFGVVAGLVHLALELALGIAGHIPGVIAQAL